tara:strand:+ start:1169 stop:1330 length:162 start_codon:yes stop_codon:yes gene_type:complete
MSEEDEKEYYALRLFMLEGGFAGSEPANQAIRLLLRRIDEREHIDNLNVRETD